MDKIQELLPEVIDQIAAGEVVERPAHLVKELVENSLDAGATSITIEFSMGGQKVKVIDNGCGISRKDLSLAFARHATSKIRNSEDLWSLASFGFRGEALASLSAVSKVKMISKTAKDKQANSISGEFGKFTSVESTGGTQGTTIWVDDLFGNVPARKKFLKSDSAEASQIKNVIKALALFHHNVEFKVLYKGELQYYWPIMSSHLERVKQVLEMSDLYRSSGECEGVKAEVFVSAPHQTQKTRKQMWFFAQGRWIQDTSLQAAVMDAYRGLLMHGEYPYAVVFLQTSPEEIDVNVHPTKSQVKFSKAANAFRAVHRAIRSVLEEAPWLDKILQKQVNTPLQNVASDFSISDKKTQELITNMNFVADELLTTQWQQKEYNIVDSTKKLELAKQAVTPTLSTKISRNLSTGKAYWQSLQILNQAALTYIVCQSQHSLVIIDQHAAHERVVYETLMASWLKGDIEIQNLLLPLQVNLDPEMVEAIISHNAELKKMGLEVEAMGPDLISVSTLPLILKEKAVVKAIEFLGQELVEKGGSFAIEKALSEIAATLACHSVIRAGQSLSLEEMRALLVSMDEYALSSFCPHGRPVFVEILFTKLKKDFGRTV
ncbi:MAG: DNA mismatch repair endonuclease MutL [Bdellovibrionales bacterium]|nr:DNA mismatch repair endonuclease MutL [Bdellovibrionales bacterium]